MNPLIRACALLIALAIPKVFAPISLAADSAARLGDHRVTLSAGFEEEDVGPLLSYRREPATTSWTFSPIASYAQDRDSDVTEFDLIYPLLTYDRFGPEYRFQFFQLFSFGGAESNEGDRKQRFTVFPFFFYQSSSKPDENYTAFLPFYGHLRDRLFRDEIRFVMLPAYAVTRKRDIVTANYLYPFFHIRRGGGLHGWQFWPLFGHEHKELTTRKDQFGEEQMVGGHDRVFALWPFFFKNDLGIGTNNPEKQRVILPFFSRQDSPLRTSTTYFWPLGFTVTEDREKKYREWGAPWPLIVFSRGEGKTVNRIWPFFSEAKNPTLESDFYFWPLYKFNRITSDPLDRTRIRILLFLYSDVIEKNTSTGSRLQRTDLWPIFSARRGHDGSQHLQVLALLEPLLPNSRAIERNYSPLWSIWRSESNPKMDRTTRSFLWNLYRRETWGRHKKLSLLFGLLRYDIGPEGGRWRILNLPVGKREPARSN